MLCSCAKESGFKANTVLDIVIVIEIVKLVVP